MAKRLAVSGLVLWAAFALAAPCFSAQQRVHRIGVLASEGKVRAMQAWTPSARYLESRIPGEKFEIVPLTYDALRSAVRRGEADFIYTNPSQYVELNRLYALRALASVKRRINGAEMQEYGSVVFTLGGSGVKSLGNLRGKRIASSSPRDFGGWLAGLREMRAAGLTSEGDFSGVIFTGAYNAVVDAVLDGRADAGVVRTGALERMAAEQRISISDFSVIKSKAARSCCRGFPLLYSTRLYPDWPFSAARAVDAGLAARVADALLSLEETSAAAGAAGISGWIKPGDYHAVLECLKELPAGYFSTGRTEGDWSLFYSEHSAEAVLMFSLVAVLFAALALVLINKRRLAAANVALRGEIVRRIRAETEREAEHLRAGIILGAISEGVMELDGQGAIVFVNPVGERLLGWKPGELAGRPAHETCQHSREDGKPYPREQSPIALACAEGGGYRSANNIFWRKDGTFFPADYVVTPLVRDGVVSGAVVIFRDISQRIRMEQEVTRAREAAEAANSAKTFFMANMTHELRTPISAITGFMDLTLETSLPPLQRDYLLTARRAADHLLSVINDILDIAKIESSQLALETISFDVRRCVADAIQALRPQAETKNLYLRVDISSDLPAVVAGDAKRLAQVVSNLVGNAIKFTHNGGITVKVAGARTEASFTELEFSVTDTGIGIAPEYAQNIFKPFSQGDSSSTRKYGGNGLGLAIARHVISLMGGRIWFDSVPGGGTAFHFLARFNTRPGLPGEDRLTYGEPQAMALVVADRHDSGLNLLFSALDGLHIKYEVVLSQRDALEACSGERYTAVIVDMQSPGLEGPLFPRLLREREEKARLPILALTGAMDHIQVQACLEAGYDAIIGKPLMREDVIRALTSTLHL